MSEALVFDSDGRELVGVIDVPRPAQERGILILTGGPQYRVGSHRQFVLLARAFSEKGYPVMRFDYRGMGDSEGELTNFLDCEDDLRAALNVFRQRTGVSDVVVWGLCDAASASLMYVARYDSVAGLVLVNPWVRSDESLARTHLRHYYLRRVFSRGFVRDLFTGQVRVGKGARELFTNLRRAVSGGTTSSSAETRRESGQEAIDFREKMLEGFLGFSDPILILICGMDLTAKEFVDHTDCDRRWRRGMRRRSVSVRTLDGADHTFSRREWRDQLTQWTLDWLGSS